MASIKEAIMQMALKQFTNELKNPNSEVSKRFNSMLYGNKQTGEGGLFDKLTDSTTYTDKNPIHSEGEIQQEMQHYKRTPSQAIIDNLMPSLATAADVAGTGIGTYKSLLGDALIAISEGVKSKGFDNPFAMATALGMGKKANGVVQNALFSGSAKILNDVSKDIKKEREKEREAELLLRERPSGQFYDARRQLTK